MLKTAHILGLNAREKYIRRYNAHHSLKLANDKIYTREILQQHGVPTPQTLAVIEHRKSVIDFDFEKLPREFVIKPNKGSRGRGILLLKRHRAGVYQKNDRSYLTLKQIHRHCWNIIEGAYSMEGFDSVLIEQKLKIDSVLGSITEKGLPDVRVIVFNLVPIMAMLRLPTAQSDGKANLHAGAFGLGLDLKTGKITHGIDQYQVLTLSSELRNFEVPFWNEILDIAVQCQDATEIGYLGVDIIIDQDEGPVVVEINAQPGLEIQNANRATLRNRLQRVEKIKVKDVKEGVYLGKELFGERSEDIQFMTRDKILAIYETVQVVSKLGTIREVQAKVDPHTDTSSVDVELARRLGFETRRKHIHLKAYIYGKETELKCELFQKTDQKAYTLILGRKDLRGYYLDLSRKLTPLPLDYNPKRVNSSMEEVDEFLCEVEKKFHIIRWLIPENLQSEKETFMQSKTYNPIFRYKALPINASVVRDQLKAVACDASPLGILLEKKRDFMLQKLALAESIGGESFFENSISLYGSATELDQAELKKQAKKYRYGNSLLSDEKKYTLLTFDEVLESIQNVLDQYNLNNWSIKVQDTMLTRFAVTKSGSILVRSGIQMTDKALRSLLVHEIETHILTAENAFKQPYKIFQQGWAHFLRTQEGLAIYNQIQYEGSDERYQMTALGLQILYTASTGSFRDAFYHAMEYTDDPDRAWNIVMRMKRGVADTSQAKAYTKRLVYYHGYHLIRDYFDNGGDRRDLYVGKVALEDIALLKKLSGIQYDNLLLPNFKTLSDE